MPHEKGQTGPVGSMAGSAMRRVVESVWQDSASNFGGGSWKLTLECGHEEWRKGSQGIPRRCLCRDCKLGRPSLPNIADLPTLDERTAKPSTKSK